MKPLQGVVPVVPTPFLPDESIDVSSLRRVVDWIAGRGLAGMCLPAYGSEFYKLSEAERDQVITVAVEVNNGRLPVVAQANHGSARVVIELAERYQALGVDIISFALPRQFATSSKELLDYCGTIASATPLPILIQDFNPGGPTIDSEFVATINGRHKNFRYVKLEAPMMVDTVVAIREQLEERVVVLEGWGGLYMLEGIAAGIGGIMPGAAIADLLDMVFTDAHSGDLTSAHELFGSLLPYINFSLQNFELFLQMEKRVLVRRGFIESPTVRSPSHILSSTESEHVDFLIAQLERTANMRSPSIEWIRTGAS